MNNTIIITNTNYTITTTTTMSSSARIQYLVCDLGTKALLWLRVGSRMSKLRAGRRHLLSANNYISFLYTQQMIAIVKPRCNVFPKVITLSSSTDATGFLCLL